MKYAISLVLALAPPLTAFAKSEPWECDQRLIPGVSKTVTFEQLVRDGLEKITDEKGLGILEDVELTRSAHPNATRYDFVVTFTVYDWRLNKTVAYSVQTRIYGGGTAYFAELNRRDDY